MMDGSGAMDGSARERAALWRLLFMSMIWLLNTVEGELKDAADLTLIDIGCLFALNNAGATGRTMGSLASLFSIDPSVITYRVKRLEAKDLVGREVSDDNRRYTYARLTPAGRAILKQARTQMLQSADTHFFAHCGDAERQSLQQILESLVAAQRASDGAAHAG